MGEVSSGFIAFEEPEHSWFAGDKVMSSDLFDLESDLLGGYGISHQFQAGEAFRLYTFFG